jgi:hypothetical protein
MRMLENIQQKTIAPVIRTTVVQGTHVYTDEDDIDACLSAWGDAHTVGSPRNISRWT